MTGSDPRSAMGRRAEGLCRGRLRRAGWKILDTNWRTPFGELDLIAIDGRTLVFVEVKSSGPIHPDRPGPERPVLAVGADKQKRLRRLADTWLTRNAADRPDRLPGKVKDVRFDVVGIEFGPDGTVVEWEHLEDAF